MHNAESYDLAVPPGGAVKPPNLCIEFSAHQEIRTVHHKLSDLMREKIAKREFFYGIELTPRSWRMTKMDFNIFGEFLPLFTSIVWLCGEYAKKPFINDVPAVQFAQYLENRTEILSHFAAYHLQQENLKEFLDLNLTNVFVVRGDRIHEDQDYQYAVDLVKEIRKIRGDSISIGVAGYPERHPDSKSLKEDLTFLKQKVDAGADFIITQICYSAKKIMDFIRNCRTYGINVPIIVGIFAPENIRPIDFIAKVANIRVADEDYEALKNLSATPEDFCDYTAKKAVETIQELLSSDLGIYGFQFFTLNKFKNVQKIVDEIKVGLETENKI